MADEYGAVREEYDEMRQLHQRAVFVVDDTRTVRFATIVDAESPDDIDLSPINDMLRDLLGQDGTRRNVHYCGCRCHD